MAEYIEKGAAKYAVDLAMDLSDTEYDAICNAIDKAPSADVDPVVHGRWIETLVPDGYVQKASRLRKQCSVCGWTNACRYNYCPHCGAKMDLEVN